MPGTRKARCFPATAPYLGGPHGAADFYELDVYERIVEGARQCDPRIYAVVLLAGDGGLRRGQIIGLELAEVDFKSGLVIVHARSLATRKPWQGRGKR